MDVQSDVPERIMNLRNIIFRTDASLQIGTGHVMRCLTLAKALRELGASCDFVCRAHPGNLIELIKQQGFVVHTLPHDPDWESLEMVPDHAAWLGMDWQTDAEQTKASIDERAIDWLIVDHYALDIRWEKTLRPLCRKLMVIDDLADRSHDSDLLLDQNLVNNLHHRYDGRVPIHCARLLGPEYALLQAKYADLHPRTPPRVGPIKKILVFFGGVDRFDLTGRTISAFLALDRTDITLDVVINPASPHHIAIRKRVQDCANITLHETLPSLAPLMLKADLAIGAGGATAWERCCLGLPSIVITMAENQKPIAAELNRQGFVRWLGHHDLVSEPVLIAAMQDVLKESTVSDWSLQCLSLVDGKGTEKVASIILLDSATEFKARLACLEDEALILSWANDPLVRQNAFNMNTIDPESHRLWFYERLRNPDFYRIYIMETNEGIPIGQVRFEQLDSVWYIGYLLDPALRGRHLGTKLLQTALQAFQYSIKDGQLVARVKLSNIASQKIFEKLGFTVVAKREELVYHYGFSNIEAARIV